MEHYNFFNLIFLMMMNNDFLESGLLIVLRLLTCNTIFKSSGGVLPSNTKKAIFNF